MVLQLERRMVWQKERRMGQRMALTMEMQKASKTA
jgi:hypothetical protein